MTPHALHPPQVRAAGVTLAAAAATWALVFAAVHVYWAAGGTAGLDGERVTGALLVIDLAAVPLGLLAAWLAAGTARPELWPGGRRLLKAGVRTVAAVLVLRGAAGIVQTAAGAADDVPWGVQAADPFFLLGGLLFAALALPAHPRPTAAMAGYAASALAIAYAVLVRGYHAAGGTLGTPGRLEDPEGMQRASLLAGLFLLAVGIGALAFVRPWGLRLPRWLVILPALAGSAFAIGHAIVAYVTKPLHAIGAIELEWRGWVEIDETGLILWDLLFYEPWFLALGVTTTLGALHHHRRTGGSPRAARRLAIATAAAALALGAAGSLMVAT